MYIARYCFFAQGKATFLRCAAGAQEEVVAPHFSSSEWSCDADYFKRNQILRLRATPAALGGLEVVGLVGTFIATCFAKKVFDEVYDRTLKRPIARQLDKIFSNAEMPAEASIEVRDVVYLEDLDLAVVVRAFAKQHGTEELQAQVLQAHRVAHEFIERHGRKAPVHCHKIERGKIALQPELFDSLQALADLDHREALSRQLAVKATNRPNSR